MIDGDGVVLLGVKGGPSVLPNGSMPTASLVTIGSERIVLDCGLGVTGGLTRQGVRLQTLRTIVITHLHSDHYLELGPLIHTAWTCGLKERITIYGPSGLAGYWRGFLASMDDDIALRIADEARPPLAGLVEIRVLDEATTLKLGNVSVRVMKNRHPPLTESYAVAFETAAARIVFSGDTTYFDGMAAFARGADLLVHEVMFGPGIERVIARVGLGDKLRHHLVTSHTLAEDVGRVAADAAVRALALHHFVPGDDPDISADDWTAAVRRHYQGPLHIGRDGLEIRLGQTVR